MVPDIDPQILEALRPFIHTEDASASWLWADDAESVIREVVAAATQTRDAAVQLVREFTETGNDECAFDHHGYCQHHPTIWDEPGYCTTQAARKFLAGLGGPDPESDPT